jgi:hypothetical protein
MTPQQFASRYKRPIRRDIRLLSHVNPLSVPELWRFGDKTELPDITGCKPVVVATAFKGLFFGWVKAEAVEWANRVFADYDAWFEKNQDKDSPKYEGAELFIPLTVYRMRAVLYWAKAEQGIEGLRGIGPCDRCRISHAAPAGVMFDVAAIIEVKEETLPAWEAAPWGNG